MALSIFAEKDFSRIFSDVNGYGHIFLDQIHEWNWYDNSDHEAYHYHKLIKLFYTSIDQASINFDTNQFMVHMPTGDIVITLNILEDYTHVPSNPHHRDPLPLIDYMTDRGLAVPSKIGGSKPVLRFAISIALDAGSNATY